MYKKSQNIICRSSAVLLAAAMLVGCGSTSSTGASNASSIGETGETVDTAEIGETADTASTEETAATAETGEAEDIAETEDMPFPTEAETEEVELPAFLKLNEVKSANIYSYTPSELGAATLTSTIIVLPEENKDTEEEAMTYLTDAGFIDFAEENKAGVILMNKSADTWGEQDVENYDYIIDALAGTQDDVDRTYLGYTTWLSQIYMVGEGESATFINDYMTQHCDVLAGVVTFGGDIKTTTDYTALPAYLIGCPEDVIDYYKAINDVDECEESDDVTVWYNKDYSTKKVMVDDSTDQTINIDLFEKAYDKLLSKTNRSSLRATVWGDGYKEALKSGPLTLMDRPDVEALGLVENGLCTDEEAVPGQTGWYEWIPEEALSEDNEEKFPLVMVYHGAGDDPEFEAEQNGWVQMAGEERFIVVAATDNDADNVALFGDPQPGGTDRNIALLDYIIDKYPVDESRIYLVGFSLGGVNTIKTAESNLDRFAAIAPCSYPSLEVIIGNSVDSILDYEAYGYDPEKYDLPVFYFSGTKDSSILPTDDSGNFHFSKDTGRFYNQVFKLNEIDENIDVDNLDFDKYPWFGFETEYNTDLCFTNKHGQEINTVSYENEDGVEMFRCMYMTDGNHNHYTEIGRYAWDYLKHFSRDTETKEIIFK